MVRISNPRLTIVPVLAGFLALSVIVAMTFWLNARTQALFDNVVTVRAVRAEAGDLQSAIQSAESSQRGYLYTHNQTYLSPFNLSQMHALKQLALLQESLADYPSLEVESKRLREVVTQKFLEMNQTISLEKQYRSDEARAMITTNEGKTLMDEAKIILANITHAADQRLLDYVSDQQKTAARLKSVSALSVMMILIVILIVYRILANYTHQLTGAQAEVLTINTALEIRVQERSEALRHVSELLKAAKERAEALLVEVNHRVANSLTMTITLLKMQASSIKDKAAKDALDETRERIFAISLVHRKLYTSGDVGFVVLDDYLAGLLSHIQDSIKAQQLSITLRSKIAPIKLSVDQSISLGVVCNELISNALKYAYPDRAGEIRLALKCLSKSKAELTVADDGVGMDRNQPQGTGFGTKIISAMATSLAAEIVYEQGNPGTIAKMIFPLPRVDGEAHIQEPQPEEKRQIAS